MYKNSEAIIRPELSALVEEAAAADSYFIGLQVFPVFNSERKTGEFHKITKGPSELLKSNVTVRAPGGAYGRVDRTYVKDSFNCTDRGLEEVLDDSVVTEMSSWFDMEQVASRLLLRAIMIDLERRVAGIVMNTANWDNTATTEAYTEAKLAAMDPIFDLLEAKKRVEKRGELVNALVLNQDVFDRIRRADKVAKYFFGPNGGGHQVTTGMLAEALGIPQILIGRATEDTAAKGKTATPTYIWGPQHIWMGNIQGGSFTAGGAGRTVVWTGDAASTFVTETYRSEQIRSDVIRVRTHSDEKIISKPAGELLVTNWA